MEQKKALAVFIKSFRYFICMVLLLGIAVFACSAVFRDAKVLNTVEVAVVIPKEKGEELRLLTGLAFAGCVMWTSRKRWSSLQMGRCRLY